MRTNLRSHRQNIPRLVPEHFLQALRGWQRPTFVSLVSWDSGDEEGYERLPGPIRVSQIQR
jgi:hypothetical protein